MAALAIVNDRAPVYREPMVREQVYMPNMDPKLQEHWRRFGKYLGELINRAQMTETDFAASAEMTTTQVSRILNGHSGTRRSTLPRFVRSLRMGGFKWTPQSIEELYERAGFVAPGPDAFEAEIAALREGAGHYDTDMRARLVSFYDGMNPEGQEDLLHYAELVLRRKPRRRQKREPSQ